MTPKQTLFVSEYLANVLNATKAAVSAVYSEKTAQEQGSRLLSNAMVAGVIAEKTLKRTARLGYTVDRVLDMARKMAFFDVRRMLARPLRPSSRCTWGRRRRADSSRVHVRS